MDFDKYFDNLNELDETCLRNEKTVCCTNMNRTSPRTTEIHS